KAPELSMRPFALSLSVTAESRPSDGKVLFFCTMLFKLTHGTQADKLAIDMKHDLLSTVFEQIKGEPGVKKKVQVEGVNTWLTNLRISTEKSGNRMQITGYAFGFQEMSKVYRGLLDSGKAPQTMLSNCNANTYYGFPVLRFDLVSGDSTKAEAQVALSQAVIAMNDAVEVANTSIQDLRISPAIKTDKGFDYPMEVSFKQMEIDQWEQVKTKLSGYASHGAKVQKIGELKALADEGSKMVQLIVTCDLDAK
ncbi:MAG TPA: hypothetical protein PKO06_25055, partial [Candidatus Ozemobacteraceae bacterium]|nr:hypothetical protein [Candidatus Ozemobacteraceae bacterium]